jgi:hypothetical protein
MRGGRNARAKLAVDSDRAGLYRTRRRNLSGVFYRSGIDPALKAWGAIGTLAGILTGAIPTYFFRRANVNDVKDATKDAHEAMKATAEQAQGVARQTQQLLEAERPHPEPRTRRRHRSADEEPQAVRSLIHWKVGEGAWLPGQRVVERAVPSCAFSTSTTRRPVSPATADARRSPLGGRFDRSAAPPAADKFSRQTSRLARGYPGQPLLELVIVAQRRVKKPPS